MRLRTLILAAITALLAAVAAVLAGPSRLHLVQLSSFINFIDLHRRLPGGGSRRICCSAARSGTPS